MAQGSAPLVEICFVDHAGSCNSPAGWQVEDPGAGLDPCSATKMRSAKLGGDDAVWIDDTTPGSYTWRGAHGRQAMANCERLGLGRPPYRIFVGCSSGTRCDVTHAENVGEYYPFHWLASCHEYLSCSGYPKPSNPSVGYSGCPTGGEGALNGFLTQRSFAWGNGPPPTAAEGRSEWHYADSCVPAGATMPMGRY